MTRVFKTVDSKDLRLIIFINALTRYGLKANPTILAAIGLTN